MTPASALDNLWLAAGGARAALASISLCGADPTLPSVYRVGTLASASIGATALAAAQCWQQRTGQAQQVEVDMRRALAIFRSDRYLRVDNGPALRIRDAIAGFYPTRDGRWIQLHTNFPHHRDGVLAVLGCGNDRAAVAAAIAGWDGAELDRVLADAGLCAALIRSPDEWAAHAQASAVAKLPLLEIVKLGDSPPEPIGRLRAGPPTRALSGVRALDLTRIIAGPVAGRALAQHGAQVLLVTSPKLPSIAPLVIDTGRGKRTTELDLNDAQACASLRTLVREADIFMQAYRPGSLARRGFGPQQLAALRPGIIAVTISAYGHTGPWGERRGYDSLVQSASGIAWTEGRAAGLSHAQPQHLPCQALDHGTGYLAAYGAMMALHRRALEGGSWLVRVSLAQTGHWLDSLGRVADGLQIADTSLEDVQDCLETVTSPFGTLRCVAPAERLSATPAYLATPPLPLGTDAPVWADEAAAAR